MICKLLRSNPVHSEHSTNSASVASHLRTCERSWVQFPQRPIFWRFGPHAVMSILFCESIEYIDYRVECLEVEKRGCESTIRKPCSWSTSLIHVRPTSHRSYAEFARGYSLYTEICSMTSRNTIEHHDVKLVNRSTVAPRTISDVSSVYNKHLHFSTTTERGTYSTSVSIGIQSPIHTRGPRIHAFCCSEDLVEVLFALFCFPHHADFLRLASAKTWQWYSNLLRASRWESVGLVAWVNSTP